MKPCVLRMHHETQLEKIFDVYLTFYTTSARTNCIPYDKLLNGYLPIQQWLISDTKTAITQGLPAQTLHPKQPSHPISFFPHE